MEKSLIKSLLRTSSYDEPTASVRLLQTHVSCIFITDRYVYKVKKGVDLGFLNFTTLDRRRFYCDEEVRLNRRLCPDIYIGVVEIRESATGMHIGGDGAIVDYAVKMKKLPEERMLDRLLAEGGVTTEDIRRLARVVAAFHETADRGDEIDHFGTVEAIRHNWDENVQQLRPFVGETFASRDLQIIRDWADRFITSRRHLFEERVAGGYIRDCDGDLHAENICLTDEICIFDCIEFDARFRYSDTAADIAFLLMDFEFHGQREFSALFREEYRMLTGDNGMTELLDFYKMYRAVVRAKVESFRLGDRQVLDEEKTAARVKASRYAKLARGYCLREKLRPSLILTCGLMGSGKSTLAAELAFQLGIEVVSSDRVRKERAALPCEAHADSPYGTGLYSPSADEETYRELLLRAEAALQKGETVIIDATFRHKRQRRLFRAAAERRQVPLFIVHTVCTDRLARERLDRRRQSPGGISDGRRELFPQQKREFDPLEPDEQAQIFIDTSQPANDTIDEILKRMALL